MIPPVFNSAHQDQGQDELRKKKIAGLSILGQRKFFNDVHISSRPGRKMAKFHSTNQLYKPHLAAQRLISVDSHYYEYVVTLSI